MINNCAPHHRGLRNDVRLDEPGRRATRVLTVRCQNVGMATRSVPDETRTDYLLRHRHAEGTSPCLTLSVTGCDTSDRRVVPA